MSLLLPRRSFLLGTTLTLVSRLGRASFAVPPNDPDYPSQWQFSQINLEAAWNIHQGTSATVIAIIDTGINVTTDMPVNTIAGYNEVSGAATPTTDWFASASNDGHGSMVASLTAGATANAINTAGIAPNATIMPIVACQTNGICNGTPVSDAIHFAADNGAHILGMSLNSGGSKAQMDAACSYAWSKGCNLSAITGNTGTSNPTAIPASCDNVCGVGSVKSDDTIDPSSTTGCVKIVAPGGTALSGTIGPVMTSARGVTVNNHTGTSFARPQIDGVWALMRTANSRYAALRNDEMNLLLFSKGADIVNGIAGWPTIDSTYGYGRLNAGKAVAAAQDYVRPFAVRALAVGGL